MRRLFTALLFLQVLLFASVLLAQTLTYHVDNPSGVKGQWLLSTSSPTGTVWTVSSQSLIGIPTGEYFIGSFTSASGDPGRVGTIPSGSTVTFTVSMQESKSGGTIFPRAKLYLNSASGALFCAATGTTAITASATRYTFSCSTTAALNVASTDRFYLWVGVNITKAPTGGGSLTANLQFNGSLGGVADSMISAPVPLPPSITSLSVNSGNAGTPVTISGSHFGSTTGTVTFNGVNATASSWNDGSIGTSVPTMASTGNVVVMTANGSSNGVNFTVPPPSISNLSTSSGAAGTPVIITGTHFGASQGSGTVAFDGTIATVPSWSDTSLSTSVPVSATTGNVVVTAANGEASSGVLFNVPAPVITNISPDFARVGNSVTITGSNFGSVQGSLTFNGTAASPSTWTNTQIVAPVPNGATTGSVVVTQAGVSNSVSFTVDPPPSIASISPTSGPVNASVTVTGSGFGIAQGTSRIQFNGTTAVPFSWSDSSIIVQVPSGATSGPVTVAAGGLNSNGMAFTVTAAPSITSLSVSSGAPGTPVTITGQNFGSTQGNSVVRFNGIPAFPTSWGIGSIGVTVPSGATTGPVTVTVSNQTTNGVTFTVITTGIISGAISRAVGGSAISGATLQALQNGTIKASATSAGDGTYSIPNLQSGNYDIQASASGFGTALINSVVVTGGQTATANFSLSSPGAISGRVTQADGVTAIPGATVQLFVGSAAANTTLTDSSGNYSIGGLNAGSYALEASAANFVTQTQTAAVAGGNTTTANLLLQPLGTNPINYVYDELGRLVSVIDSSGDTATYKYDAVGNILSISRQNSNKLSIISFTPPRGTSGTSVTINGTGFSTTPSQNTVTFNGVSATVVSATATQLTTTVPATVTTGPINVTTPSDSVTSSANFTVLSPPAITGFSPNMGTSGTAVSITGANFDFAPNDNVMLNTTYAAVTSATGSQINTSVPAATGSGRISVATPAGTAISTQDFYVPFGTHVVTDIGYTGRLSASAAQTVSLASGKIGLLLFDATAHQGVSLQFSNSTFATCTLYLYSPTQIQVTQSDCTSATASLASLSLPDAGTYTIGIDPGTSSGSITIGLTQDIAGSITAGVPVNFTTTASGEAARYTFKGAAGQIVSTEVAGFGGGNFTVSISNSAGTILASGASQDQVSLIGISLPSSGTYTIIILPSGSGSATVSLINQATNGGIGFNTPTTVTLNTSSLLGFNLNGTSGTMLSVEVSGLTGRFWLYILNPDGSVFASVFAPNTGFGANPASILARTLGSNGSYQVIVVPANGVTGSVTVSLISRGTNGTLNFNAPLTSTITAPSLMGLNFSGNAGQIVTLEAAGLSGSFSLYLLNPDGTALASNTCCSGNTVSFIGKTLPSTGTYQVIIVPNNGVAGSVTVSLVSQTTNSTINFNTPITSTITSSSLTGLSFSGSAGQIVSAEAAGLNGSFSLYLLNPDGTTLASSNCCGATLSLVGKTLSSTGTYQILVIPNNGVTGSVTVSLVSQTTNSTINSNTPVASTIASSSLIGLSFNGTAGQIVSVEGAGLNGNFSLYLLKPDGTTLASNTCCGATLTIVGKTLSSTGTYQIIVVPNNGVTGSITISVINQNTNGSISFGTPVTSNIAAASLLGLNFSGTAGQVVSLEVAGLGGGAFSVSLLNPDGSTLASTSACCGTSQISITGKTLATTGTYQIIIAPNNGVTGSATVSLISQTTNPSISFGTPITSQISVASLIGLSFSGTAGQVVSLEMAGLGGGSFTLFLLNPNGSTLASTSACCGTAQATITGKTLATTGTYQIVVVPNNGVTGSATLSLISQTTNAAIIIGTPVTNAVSTTSLIGLSFSGTAGQTISVQISPAFAGGRFTAYLLNPNGSTLTSASSTTLVTFSGKTLGSTGTYQIVIAPNNSVTGSATTTVTSP